MFTILFCTCTIHNPDQDISKYDVLDECKGIEVLLSVVVVMFEISLLLRLSACSTRITEQ